MEKCKRCGLKTVLNEAEVQKMVDEVKNMRGIRLVNGDAYSARLNVCGECEKLLYGSTCGMCGCVVQVRALLAEGRCPAKKWC